MIALYEPRSAERALRGFFTDPFFSSQTAEPFFGLPRLAGPPVDIVESDEQTEIVADVPGLTRDQVQVEVDHGWVELRADLEQPGRRASFVRRFHLSGAHALDAATASLEGGVLRIRIPKGRGAAARKVPISTGAPKEGVGADNGFLERAKRRILGLVRGRSSVETARA